MRSVPGGRHESYRLLRVVLHVLGYRHSDDRLSCNLASSSCNIWRNFPAGGKAVEQYHSPWPTRLILILFSSYFSYCCRPPLQIHSLPFSWHLISLRVKCKIVYVDYRTRWTWPQLSLSAWSFSIAAPTQNSDDINQPAQCFYAGFFCCCYCLPKFTPHQISPGLCAPISMTSSMKSL